MDTSTSPSPGNPPDKEEPVNAQRAFWAAVIFTFIALASFIFSFVLIRTHPAWQVYVISAITAFALAADLTGMIFILRGRTLTGIKWFYWSLMITIPPNVLLVTNTTPILLAFVLVIGFVNVFYLLPRTAQKSYRYGPVLAALFIALVEVFQPPFRINLAASFSASGYFGPITLAFLIVSVILLVLWQSRSAIAASLRLKIIVWTGVIVVVLSSVLVAYSVVNSRRAAIESAQAEALAIAESQARQIQTDTAIPLSMARSLAHALTAVKDPAADIQLSRDQVNAMLRQVLIENPAFLGTYTLWEPNAFDQLDATYKNTPVHDASGRFIPYWVRGDDGSVDVIALEQYETPGIGDWYILPRQTRREMTFAPLIYPIDGVDTVMASFVVPILYDDQFYGIAGVDAPIAFVQQIVDNVNLYDGSADAVLMTSSGTLIGVRNRPELVNQPASMIYPDFSEFQQQLETGQAFIITSPDGGILRVFAPVELGQSGSHWIFGLSIPYSEITASATAAAQQESILGVGLLVLSMLVLWFFTGQIASSIHALTNAANAITGGDLNAAASVRTSDEIGLLAGAFNTMTSRLRGTLATLEERVADRTRNLELAAEVGRAVSQVRALEIMLTDAAELIRNQFDLYYVQVYLTNPSRTTLNLQAGTGSVGVELLRRNHQLPVNTASINGRAAVEKRSVVIEDTSASAAFHPNPLLPETRSEMAIPLLLGGDVAGVLDLQSRVPGSLNPEMLTAFEALAGQLAVAIQNARLLAEAGQARADLEAQTRRLVRKGWDEYLDAIHQPEQTGFVFEGNKIAPLEIVDGSSTPLDENAISIPITITGEPLGSLIVEMEGRTVTSQNLELAQSVTRQVAQKIESLRLLETAERYRAEAEEASRRVTREGWKAFAETTGETLGYVYNLKEVRPFDGAPAEAAGTIVPLKVREEVVGKLAVQGLDAADKEGLELSGAVAERLSAHIESLRQFNQTQSALAQSEKLFEASRRLTQAAGLQELTAVAVEAINIPVVNRAIMTSFTYNSEGRVEGLDVISNWWNGTGLQATAVGTHYSAEVVRMIPMFVSPSPLFFNDAFHDERVDPATMNLVQRLTLRSVAVLPLHAGAEQIGVLMLEGEEPHNFTQEEMRLFVALGPQIATVLENRRQFERAQKQAEREAMLNVINQKIQGATSVEAVLQIAARELGHALGAPMTVAQLSLKDTSA